MMDEELNASPEAEHRGKLSESVVKYDYKEEWIEDKDYQSVFRKVVSNQENYENYLKEVAGDGARLANVLWTKVFNETKKLYGMQNGDLDDNKIVEAVNGIKTVHTLKIPKKDKKVNIIVLIDESGSMYGRKAMDAARMAVMLEHAYKVFPVGQLFIYGFTSDHGEDFNTVYRYREPGLDVKFGLGSVEGRSNNRDGHAIRAVAKRVRKFTQDPMLYFIISDGQPAGERYSGTGAIKDTANAIKEVTKMKFYPIQIGIEVDESIQAKMYTDFINYKSSRQMVEGIRKLLLQKAHKFVGI
jgi:nitric oxide reductase activation protein